jgi:hypothetical protein
MSPARPAVHWNVLVSAVTHVVNSIDISPVPAFRKIFSVDLLMGKLIENEFCNFRRILSNT